MAHESTRLCLFQIFEGDAGGQSSAFPPRSTEVSPSSGQLHSVNASGFQVLGWGGGGWNQPGGSTGMSSGFPQEGRGFGSHDGSPRFSLSARVLSSQIKRINDGIDFR